MATVPTTFRPDPTCFAASNLWFDTYATDYYRPCNTYYEPFASRPTELVTATACVGTVRLGPPGETDEPCHQRNWASETEYSACPEGMTGAQTSSSTLNGVVIIYTACCPTAYDFTPAGPTPTTILQEIDGTTYPVTYDTMGMDCKAASIKELSDQTVTLTVQPPASPSPTTTEVVWDYENDFIVAIPAYISKFLYTDPRASTTSTCFGKCMIGSNPLQPLPTTHRGTYKPPPTAAVTQMTPSPSCVAPTNLWLVSDECRLPVPTHTEVIPPWLQCTHTVAGDPDEANPSCYQGPSRSTLINNTPTYFTACPSGYTAASSHTDKPFDDRTSTWSVHATTLNCCPAAFADPPLSFNYSSPSWTSTTTHSGTTYNVSLTRLPYCVASHLPSELHNQPVTLSYYSRGRSDRPAQTYEGSSETEWDTALNTVYAHAQTVAWTVFHGTYTCFENCRQYWQYLYHNTPGAAEETGADGNGGDGDGGPKETATSTAGAVAGYYGRAGEVVGQAGLGVVMVVVTVVHVVVAALA